MQQNSPPAKWLPELQNSPKFYNQNELDGPNGINENSQRKVIDIYFNFDLGWTVVWVRVRKIAKSDAHPKESTSGCLEMVKLSLQTEESFFFH